MSLCPLIAMHLMDDAPLLTKCFPYTGELLHVIIASYVLNWNRNHIGLNYFIPKTLAYVTEYRVLNNQIEPTEQFFHGIVSLDTYVNFARKYLSYIYE